MNRPIYRIKQFISARKSKISYLEVEFVRKYLNHQEQILFFRMKGFDQRHALIVAQKVLEKTVEKDWIDKPKMARVALLHDIGKSSANIGLYYRIAYVLLSVIKEGRFINFLSKNNSRLSFRRKLYVLNNHGVIGGKMLLDIGCIDNEVLQVVAKHHDKPEVNESKLLPMIREVDSTL